MNQNQLAQMGQTSTESEVNAITEPQGSTQYDTEGLDQNEINEQLQRRKNL